MEAHQITTTVDYERSSRSSRQESQAAATARRVLDILVSGSALLLLGPLMLLAALWIRLDSPGPAIFRQRRLGRDSEPFTVHKLRTMRTGADQAKHREYVEALIAGEDACHDDGREKLYKLVADDRITTFGRFLRRTSLDELPQLWDVLRGRMSLVGPRPVIAYEAECYPDWYRERFDVKPGCTGLWQVSGRNERTYEEMVELDIEYVRTRSLWLDVRILIKTLWVVFGRRGVA